MEISIATLVITHVFAVCLGAISALAFINYAVTRGGLR